MDLILAGLAVTAVVIVLTAALYVRKAVGCIVNFGMIVVGAVLLLLAVFSGPLGLFDDVETVERLRKRFGIEPKEDTAEDPVEESTEDPEDFSTEPLSENEQDANNGG